MAQILRIAQSADRFTVLNEDGTVLTSHSGKASAMAAAIAHLHAGVGGEVIMLTESGGISSRVPVAGSRGTTTPEPAATPPGTARPSAEPASAFAGPSAKEASEDIADATGEAAKAVDMVVGLKDPDPVLPKEVSDITITSLLPESAAKNTTVTLLNAHVSVAAAWIACVGLLLGTGTLSAVVQAGKRATSAGTTVGDYASTAAIFFAASAICISVAAAAWAVLAGKMSSYGALGWWVIGTAIVSGLLSQAGLAAPSQEDIVTAVAHGSGTPFGWIVSVLGAFLAYYGLFTYLSGLGVGAVLGHLAHQIQTAQDAGGSKA